MTTGELEQDEVLVFSWDGKGDGEGDGEGEAMTHAGEDHFAPRPYKQLPLADPGVRMTVEQDDTGSHGSWRITLTADRPAFFVRLEADCDGRFSDNGFLLRPHHPRIVTFAGGSDASDPVFSVNHLHEATYHNNVATGD